VAGAAVGVADFYKVRVALGFSGFSGFSGFLKLVFEPGHLFVLSLIPQSLNVFLVHV